MTQLQNATHINFIESILPLYQQRMCGLTYCPECGSSVGIGQLVLPDQSVQARAPVIIDYLDTLIYHVVHVSFVRKHKYDSSPVRPALLIRKRKSIVQDNYEQGCGIPIHCS